METHSNQWKHCLDLAATKGFASAVELRLSERVKENTKNNQGFMLFLSATQKCHTEACEMLLADVW